MDNKEFVNSAFTKSLNDYLNNKNCPNGVRFNSFYAVVMRLLVLIYSEEEILNSYFTMSEEDLYKTLKMYEYHIDDILKFMHALEDYQKNETSDGFIFIQKSLIDMFKCKKNKTDIDINEVMEFRNLLYSPLCDNPLRVSYNFLMSNKPNEIVEYFDDVLTSRTVKSTPKTMTILNIDAYKVLNYSMEDVQKMSPEELYKTNEKVYEYFDINRNTINKEYLLNKALYDHAHSKKKLQTSAGHINIVFILLIIFILIGVITFITIKIL